MNVVDGFSLYNNVTVMEGDQYGVINYDYHCSDELFMFQIVSVDILVIVSQSSATFIELIEAHCKDLSNT
jgi:hypothetical protein